MMLILCLLIIITFVINITALTLKFYEVAYSKNKKKRLSNPKTCFYKFLKHEVYLVYTVDVAHIFIR